MESTNTRLSIEQVEEYSLYTTAEKWCIIAMVSYAALFSGLSSFIYYPAIHALSQSLSVSVDKINLSVTSYLTIATVAPTLFGDLADVLGRRPVYMITLSLYVVSNVAIALSKSYPALLGLRVLQALATSATNSIAYGVIADVASPAERGSFVTGISFAVTMAPSFGPILGGLLTYAAGWPWIFWFLCIAASLCLLLMAIFLPETCRAVVGNGNIKPPKYLRLPTRIVMCRWNEDTVAARPKSRIPNPFNSLTILLRKDNAIVILAAGILYLVYSCLCTSLSVIFIAVYKLNQWQTSLVYLPFGIGGIVSTFFSGRMLDNAYRNARTKGASPNGMFGFHVATVCGVMERTVTWETSWAASYTHQLLDVIKYDNETNDPWPEYDAACKQLIEVVIPRLLGVLQSDGRHITPTLVHGDLWEGNVGVDMETEEVIAFDPGSVCAYNEVEFGTWRCPWAHHFSAPIYMRLYQRHIEPSEPVEEWDDRNRLYSIRALLNLSAGHRGSVARQIAYNDMLYLCQEYAPLEALEKYDPQKDITVTGIRSSVNLP